MSGRDAAWLFLACVFMALLGLLVYGASYTMYLASTQGG